MTSPTDRDRWLRLSQLFDRVIDLDPAARDALINAECGDDSRLYADLQQMLAADEAASDIDHGAAVAIALAESHADDEDAPPAGTRLGVWQLQQLLGRGGMGTVHAAQRDGDDGGQRAAIKRLLRRWDGSTQAQRFLQERRILAALSHPNVPRLIDHGLDDEGRPWFALEYIEGTSLTEWADAQCLDLRARIDLFRQVCAAVQHAHERFVVHRDLKPANILVDGEGHPKVLDFGVAKRIDASDGSTRTGMFAGFTPEYAAPEQISGSAITAATDVYALGVILYQLLAGQLPYRFEHDNLRDTAEVITSRTAERLDRALSTGTPEEVATRAMRRSTSPAAFRRFVRGDLTRIVQTALAKEPARRYSSVQALSTDLRRLLKGRPVSVSGDTAGYRARKFVQRNRWGVAMAGLAAAALLAGIFGIALQTRQAQAASVRAQQQAVVARDEAARQRAVSAFLFQVFSSASLDNDGRPDISLREALDLAVKQALSGRTDPSVAVVTLRAAANSYSQWDDDDTAMALINKALALQESRLPQALAERGRLLALLAYADYRVPFPTRLARAGQAVDLLHESGTHDDLAEAIDTLNNVLLEQGHAHEALPSCEALVRFMRVAGLTGRTAYNTALGTLASALSMDGQYARAVPIFEAVVRSSEARFGPDSLQATRDRMLYGVSLVRAGRHDEALRPLLRALPILRREAGNANTMTQMAVHWSGGALSELGRYAEALPYLAEAYREARKHADNPERIQSAAIRYVTALAMTGRCDLARRLADAHAPRHVPASNLLPAGHCGQPPANVG